MANKKKCNRPLVPPKVRYYRRKCDTTTIKYVYHDTFEFESIKRRVCIDNAVISHRQRAVFVAKYMDGKKNTCENRLYNIYIKIQFFSLNSSIPFLWLPSTQKVNFICRMGFDCLSDLIYNKCEYSIIFKILLNFLANRTVATKTARFITITSSNAKFLSLLKVCNQPQTSKYKISERFLFAPNIIHTQY